MPTAKYYPQTDKTAKQRERKIHRLNPRPSKRIHMAPFQLFHECFRFTEPPDPSPTCLSAVIQLFSLVQSIFQRCLSVSGTYVK